MTVKISEGDILRQDDVDAIVNTVNCVGVMGKGIALQFKNKWPENFRAYEAACKVGNVRLGRMFVFDSGGLVKPNYIINFPTKGHWRGNSKIAYIRDGLVDLIAQIKKLRITSLAMPPLGCGNGGLDWNEVKPIIVNAFQSLPSVELRLFAPIGAPDPKTMQIKTTRPAMTPGRAAILKLLETYRSLDYGLSRIEVQKLAYFLQTAGVDLKLSFEKNQYGPYSEQLRHVLNRIEGHFIRGLGDGVIEAEIEPMAEALSEAHKYVLERGDTNLLAQVARVERLIEGFQSPYGMELLATVHWVATRELSNPSFEATVRAVHQWNDRKAILMQTSHIRAALDRLRSEHWLPLF